MSKFFKWQNALFPAQFSAKESEARVKKDIVDYIKGHTRSLKKEEIKELLQTEPLNFSPSRKSYLLYKKKRYRGPTVFADLRSKETWPSLYSLEYYKGVTYLKIYAYNFDPLDEENELLKIHDNYFLAKWRYLYDKYQIPNEIIQEYEIKTGKRCFYCGKRFLPEDTKIPHHTSYHYNRTVKVHRSCHGKIHSNEGKFRSLKPKTLVEIGDFIKYLTKEEWLKLKGSIGNYLDKLIVTLRYRSGMRVGESTKLQVEDIDFSEHFIRVPPENSKTKEGRTVSVSWEVLNDLRTYLKLKKIKKGRLFDLTNLPNEARKLLYIGRENAKTKCEAESVGDRIAVDRYGGSGIRHSG